MAEQSLQARICSKYDTYENWSNMNTTGRGGNLVLKRGEIGVCSVPNEADPASPTLLFKIGDGTTIFANLPWASGLSADVYDWAKTETKPTYTAAEVGALPANTVIPTVPTALKNPKALTFTGAVTGSYDGSSEKTVNIPAAITVDDTISTTSTNPVQNKVVNAGLNTKISKAGDTFSGTLRYTGYTADSNPKNYAIALNFGSLSNIDKIDGINEIKFGKDDSSDDCNARLTTRTISGKSFLDVQKVTNGKTEDVLFRGIASPISDNDAANKAYVNAKVPDVTTSDNNKFLRVVNGTPTWVALTNVAEEGA